MSEWRWMPANNNNSILIVTGEMIMMDGQRRKDAARI